MSGFKFIAGTLQSNYTVWSGLTAGKIRLAAELFSHFPRG